MSGCQPLASSRPILPSGRCKAGYDKYIVLENCLIVHRITRIANICFSIVMIIYMMDRLLWLPRETNQKRSLTLYILRFAVLIGLRKTV